jgi:hypothetical protein
MRSCLPEVRFPAEAYGVQATSLAGHLNCQRLFVVLRLLWFFNATELIGRLVAVACSRLRGPA